MTKLENVIKGLRHCYNRKCDGCPYGYTDEHGFKICQQMEMIGDALELLKGQEPVKPIEQKGKWFKYLKCGRCYAQIPQNERPNYCSNCGRAVKWE